jgi:DNA-binding NarL/FixJ family response regulator
LTDTPAAPSLATESAVGNHIRMTSPAHAVSVAVIDDHDVIHAGIQTWLADAAPPLRLADGYLTNDEFLAAHPVPSEAVDVVVVDLELQSRRPEVEALQHVVEAGHHVVVYSHLQNSEIILRYLDAGALTYLVKSEGKTHLVEAIRGAVAEEPYVGPRMAAAMADDSRTGRPNLTAREQEVLKAWFQTESKELVAQRLFITPATVRTHLFRARAKYAAAGRPAPTKAALVARAVQDGILSIDDL